MPQFAIEIVREDIGRFSWELPETLARQMVGLDDNDSRLVTLSQAAEESLKNVCRALVAACGDVLTRDTGTALALTRRETGELYSQVLIEVCPERNTT